MDPKVAPEIRFPFIILFTQNIHYAKGISFENIFPQQIPDSKFTP